MKFFMQGDKEGFEAEVKLSGLTEAGFIKKRQGLIGRLKNHKMSQAQKQSWRHNRPALMKGIKKFHRSTLGKRFHRKLGTFLATRFVKGEEQYSRVETSVAVSSVKTHLIIGLDYWMPSLEEQVQYEMLLDLYSDGLDDFCKRILNGEKVAEEDFGFLFLFVDEGIIGEVLGKDKEKYLRKEK